MQVSVDEDRCRGHGVCCTLCPEVFTLTDDGFTVADAAPVPLAFEEAVRAAAASCPEHAIITGLLSHNEPWFPPAVSYRNAGRFGARICGAGVEVQVVMNNWLSRLGRRRLA
jgi:ferredoxin